MGFVGYCKGMEIKLCDFDLIWYVEEYWFVWKGCGFYMRLKVDVYLMIVDYSLNCFYFVYCIYD